MTADAGPAVASLYGAHYRQLVGLACRTVRDPQAAEDAVQESFAALLGAWGRLRDPAAAPAYLRRSVVNRARSAMRRQATEDRHAPAPVPPAPGADLAALATLERDALAAALRGLPGRQRQVIALRYYANLTEAQIAAVMGIRPGTVKAHASHALGALAAQLSGGPGRVARRW